MGRVENILLPIVGAGAIRASVSAEVDFTITEQTQEQYNPDLLALRSEQVTEEQSNLAGTQGVPGALSNQPPAGGVAPEVAEGGGAEGAGGSMNMNKRSIKNYELDKKISHTKLSTGRLKRVTVAVVIDNKAGAVTEEGVATSEPYSDEDVAKFVGLVKEAIGFNELRGDSVTVTNLAFKKPEVPEALPEIPLWEQTWALDLAKQAVGGIFALLLIFTVLKPTIKSLLEKPTVAMVPAGAQAMAVGPDGMPMAIPDGGASQAEGPLALETDEELMLLESPKSYEQRLEMAQKIAGEDPKRVAQVM